MLSDESAEDVLSCPVLSTDEVMWSRFLSTIAFFVSCVFKDRRSRVFRRPAYVRKAKRSKVIVVAILVHMVVGGVLGLRWHKGEIVW